MGQSERAGLCLLSSSADWEGHLSFVFSSARWFKGWCTLCVRWLEKGISSLWAELRKASFVLVAIPPLEMQLLSPENRWTRSARLSSCPVWDDPNLEIFCVSCAQPLKAGAYPFGFVSAVGLKGRCWFFISYDRLKRSLISCSPSGSLKGLFFVFVLLSWFGKEYCLFISDWQFEKGA